MTISPVETAIRDAGILSYVLFVTSLTRHRGRLLRMVVAYVIYHFLVTIFVLFLRVRLGDLSPLAYYFDTAMDFMLQVGIVIEIAIVTLGKAGLTPTVKAYLVSGLGIGVVLAAALAMSLSYDRLSRKETWDMRIDVFTSLLICTLIIGFLAITLRFRVKRSLHVSGIGRGLTLWSAVALLCDLINLYTGGAYTHRVDEVSNASWVFMIAYWSYVLWRPDRLIGSPYTNGPGEYSPATNL